MKNTKHSRIVSLRFILIIATTLLTLGLTSCGQKTDDKQNATEIQPSQTNTITDSEIATAQKNWALGIVRIGKVYSDKGDYTKAAKDFIATYYYYQAGIVLFKPTKASEKQFRLDSIGALSYFVAGNPQQYPEDHGFALEPWKSVRFENVGNKIIGNTAMSMGNYFFESAKGGKITKVEYSFGYTKDRNGNLRIILHDSHLPYVPKADDPNL